LDDLWEGKGWGVVHGVNKMVLQGLSGRKTWNLKEVGLGWISMVENIKVLNGGRKEMVVNRCFEDLKGGLGFKRVWEFIPEAGKKKIKERMKVSNDS